MKISQKYNPAEIEDKWYQFWLLNDFFNSKPNSKKEPYCVVMPPPNVTGVLHMGHMLNNTIQDVLVRKARMEGKEVCWVPGTDHASIATEAKVVQMLREKGIKKCELSREEFLKYCWEWTDKYGGIILQQLKKLGASCDWNRTRFTMEESLSDAVIDVFVDLYNKGEIYRGNRIVNWDPEAQTVVSNEEIIDKEFAQKMYYIRYNGVGVSLTVATVRPETIMADTAIAINPNDDRFKKYIGKTVYVPLINREIPIIADEHVKIDFGTGCLKITPAHSFEDYNIGIKHGLPIIDILNSDSTLNENAQILIGLDRFEARKQIEVLLKESGNLIKTEAIISTIGTSERTGAIIEPRLSLQWFLKMDRISKPALENVLNDTIMFYPPFKFKNTYKHWMENITDWCISRQLWWGHQIPVFYSPDGQFFVAKTKEEALIIAKEKYSLNLQLGDLIQDSDVLDTWFSSWLWPISVFDGFQKENHDLNYYYPTQDLVTAPEILFFWVARMIIAGYEFQGLPPFKNVYLTGIVRDKQGRKMSKSLGNSPDPLKLIEKYGADGVRTGMVFNSPAGNDLLFDEKLCEQGRNFANKIWNARRLIDGWHIEQVESSNKNMMAVEWFRSKMAKTVNEINDHFNNFRLSDALISTYNLIWDDFCGKYLEIIKPNFVDFKQQSIDVLTFANTIEILDELMRLLHPWMPFISEEVWQEIKNRTKQDSICLSKFPIGGICDEKILNVFSISFDIISNIRNHRNKEVISLKETLRLLVSKDALIYQKTFPIIEKLANVVISFMDNSYQQDGLRFIVCEMEYILVVKNFNVISQKEDMKKELAYFIEFKNSVEQKLSNDKFLLNAKPDVVDKERQKLIDADNKIKMLNEALV